MIGMSRRDTKGLFHRPGTNNRRTSRQSLLYRNGIFPYRYDQFAVLCYRCLQFGKVSTFALPTSNQQNIPVAAQSSQGRFSSTGIRSFGIIDIANARQLCDLFATMGQSTKMTRRCYHAGQRQVCGMSQCQRGKDVGNIVQTDQTKSL